MKSEQQQSSLTFCRRNKNTFSSCILNLFHSVWLTFTVNETSALNFSESSSRVYSAYWPLRRVSVRLCCLTDLMWLSAGPAAGSSEKLWKQSLRFRHAEGRSRFISASFISPKTANISFSSSSLSCSKTTWFSDVTSCLSKYEMFERYLHWRQTLQQTLFHSRPETLWDVRGGFWTKVSCFWPERWLLFDFN